MLYFTAVIVALVVYIARCSTMYSNKLHGLRNNNYTNNKETCSQIDEVQQLANGGKLHEAVLNTGCSSSVGSTR